jgi:hypothetical protein
MIYNLYGYFFQESVTQVLQFRIDLSEEMVFRFELDEAMMPVRNAIFLFDVKELKEALRQITRYLMSLDVRAGSTPKTDTDALVEELLLHLNQGDFLTLFGDPAKYDDQKAVTDFLLQLGHEKLETVPGQLYLVNDFVLN